MTRGLIVIALAAALLLPLAACGGEDGPWRDVDVADMTMAQHQQAERARMAQGKLVGSLMLRLMVALKSGGPGAAISVCREAAPQVASETAKETGVRIGRTSHRLRNPDNAPPAWARSLVERRVEGPRYRVHDDGRLAALLPIQLLKRCLPCHGPREKIPDEVRAALAEHYPTDAATGFEAGDVRGWFWIEVPAAP